MNFNKAKFLASYGLIRQIPKSVYPEIVFCGHSNVGKSSLINKVLGRKSIAKVSATPGKTSTVNFFEVENIHLVDLPGYGYAKVPQAEKDRWNKLIKGYLNDERDIALIFMLVDFRHKPTKEDLQMIDFLIENELPFVLVLTKADKLSKNQRAKRLIEFESEIPDFCDIHKIEFSSQTGEGAKEIQDIITEISQEEMQ